MKRLLALLCLVPALAFANAGDLLIYQKNSTDNAWIPVIVSGNTNAVIVTTGLGLPELSETLPNAVQANITVVGTLVDGAIGPGFTPIPNSAFEFDNITLGATTITLGGTYSTIDSLALTNSSFAGSVAATTLSASGAVSGTGFTALFASPPPIGITAPNTGNFTTLGATGNLTVNGTGSIFGTTVNSTVSVSIENLANNASAGVALDLFLGGNSSASALIDFGGPGITQVEVGLDATDSYNWKVKHSFGSGNDWLKIDTSTGNVSMSQNLAVTGAISTSSVGITNQNLTPAPNALVETAGATTINWALSNTFTLALVANLTTVTFSGAASGQNITIAVTNTVSNYAVTWGNSIKWVAGSQPIQTIGAHTDVWTIIDIGGTFYGSVVQNF